MPASKSTEKKIVCGTKAPKPTERKGTMKECAEKRQVRLYGLYMIDPKVLEKTTSKKTKEQQKKNDIEFAWKYNITRVMKVKDEYQKAKRERDLIENTHNITEEDRKKKLAEVNKKINAMYKDLDETYKIAIDLYNGKIKLESLKIKQAREVKKAAEKVEKEASQNLKKLQKEAPAKKKK